MVLLSSYFTSSFSLSFRAAAEKTYAAKTYLGTRITHVAAATVSPQAHAPASASLVHPLILLSLRYTTHMRNIAFVLFNVPFTLHQYMHDECASQRQAEYPHAYVERRVWYDPRHLAERLAFPVAGAFYGIVPTLVAQVQHLWTDRLVYVVSAKPMARLMESRGREVPV
jgi:hypothetical protein